MDARAGGERGDHVVVGIVLDAQECLEVGKRHRLGGRTAEKNRRHDGVPCESVDKDGVDKDGAPKPDRGMTGYRDMTRFLLALALCAGSALPAFAITGNAPDARGAHSTYGRALVMITGAGSSLCTGTALARDVVLTAAHCVQRPNSVVRTSKTSAALAIRETAIHPRFDLKAYALHRATADVALVRLAAPLPPEIEPAELAPGTVRPAVGDRMTVAGFGVAAANSDAGLGIARSATLAVTGQPGTLQIRLHDPATRNTRAGLGACTGDSGGPAFVGDRVAGIVAWTTGPGNSEGCGGLTGVTPLALYRGWILDQLRRMDGR